MTFNDIISAAVREGQSAATTLSYTITFGAKNLAEEAVVVDTFDRTIDFTGKSSEQIMVVR